MLATTGEQALKTADFALTLKGLPSFMPAGSVFDAPVRAVVSAVDLARQGEVGKEAYLDTIADNAAVLMNEGMGSWSAAFGGMIADPITIEKAKDFRAHVNAARYPIDRQKSIDVQRATEQALLQNPSVRDLYIAAYYYGDEAAKDRWLTLRNDAVNLQYKHDPMLAIKVH